MASRLVPAPDDAQASGKPPSRRPLPDEDRASIYARTCATLRDRPPSTDREDRPRAIDRASRLPLTNVRSRTASQPAADPQRRERASCGAGAPR